MITVTIDDSRLKERFLPAKLRAALESKVSALALMLEGYIKSDKLQGQVLKHQTGALQRSIYSGTEETGSSVTGFVRSSGDVKYAGIHEFGGDIYPVKAKALSFVIGGKRIFTKHVHMPERSFMRSALADKRSYIIEQLNQAVVKGLS